MKYRPLGRTGWDVSLICLGTMTWGQQNTEQEAHEQLDYALAQGVNFIDTAEMYPVPPKAETYTLTEQYIGTWIKKRQRRDDFYLASKIAGPSRAGDDQTYIRGGSRFSREQIFAACDASLKRLNTDYLDLYQLHWPERSTNMFGRLGVSSLNDADDVHCIAETLDSLTELQKSGKIRAFGVSNESAWGVMTFIQEHLRQPERALVASIQNPYSLLNRSYEVGLSEVSLRENVPLLAYSPLAFGMLTGKYRTQPWPQNARLSLFDRFQRYNKPKAFEAVERYAAIAQEAGLSLTALSLAFVNSRDFVGSNIIGATTLEQLKENIDSVNVELSAETMKKLDAVHAEISNPCP